MSSKTVSLVLENYAVVLCPSYTNKEGVTYYSLVFSSPTGDEIKLSCSREVNAVGVQHLLKRGNLSLTLTPRNFGSSPTSFVIETLSFAVSKN